jgi:hypothetical protein
LYFFDSHLSSGFSITAGTKMTRWQYCLYLVKRVLLACAVAGAAAAATAALQHLELMAKANWKPVIVPANRLCLRYVHRPVVRAYVARQIEFWTYPLLCALFAHVFFGPKHRRPVYLYYGRRYARAYARVKQDFNAASRGDLVTGATGSGKTQICLNPINETQTIHMCGIERPSWKNSQARQQYETLKRQYRTQTAVFYERLKEARDTSERVMAERYTPAVERFAEVLFTYLIRAYSELGNTGSLNEAAVQSITGAPDPVVGEIVEDEPLSKIAKAAARAKGEEQLSPDKLLDLLNNTSAAAMLAEMPLVLPADSPADLRTAGEAWKKARAELARADDTIALLYNTISLRRTELSRAADLLRPLRYTVFPWGGAVFDQKGNAYQQIQPLLERYDRPEDVIVLQVRPASAPDTWMPANRVNLLSFDNFPADTYAKIIVDTYNQVEECDKPDPFFVPKARNAIADGIRLMREIRKAQLTSKIRFDEDRQVVPALDLIHQILKDTTKTAYDTFLEKCGATVSQAVRAANKDARPLLETPGLTAILATLETSYWKQPQDQLGGVSGTLDNFLAPFSEAPIAELFCRDNTVNFTDVARGKVFAVSIPQRFAVQRTYINTICSEIIYQVILNRGDLRKDSPEWLNRNVIRQEKDEAQRLAIKADTNVDTIRELYGSTGLASQTQDAMWKRFGGKETATPPLSNLRNRFICKAATFSCAEESARILAKAVYAEHSQSGRSGEDKSHTTSYKEHYIISPEELMSISDFNVIFAPASGNYLYVHVIPSPVTPEGGVPSWWYGDVNPLKIAAWFLHIPRKFRLLWMLPVKLPFDPTKTIPFWRAVAWTANPRIMWRYFMGLDTTWYIVRRMSRKEAQRLASRRDHLSS